MRKIVFCIINKMPPMGGEDYLFIFLLFFGGRVKIVYSIFFWGGGRKITFTNGVYFISAHSGRIYIVHGSINSPMSYNHGLLCVPSC